MSARKRRLTITSDARMDINSLLNHTHQRWGADQRRRYRNRLFEGETLGEHLAPLTVDPAGGAVYLGSDRGILRAIEPPPLDG